MLPNYEFVVCYTYRYHEEPLASFTNFTGQLLFKVPILLNHVSQAPLLLYRIFTILMPFDADTYLRNSNEYTQVDVQYPYVVMSPESYAPLRGPQCNLCTCMELVYCCENTQLLRHISEHTS